MKSMLRVGRNIRLTLSTPRSERAVLIGLTQRRRPPGRRRASERGGYLFANKTPGGVERGRHHVDAPQLFAQGTREFFSKKIF